MNSDPLVIAGRTFRSRLIVGTGKYPSHVVMADAHRASAADMVTVAVRRVNLSVALPGAGPSTGLGAGHAEVDAADRDGNHVGRRCSVRIGHDDVRGVLAGADDEPGPEGTAGDDERRVCHDASI